jgi:threonylcarbamoyladenosine tRNA methylthiotransferase MtaB
VSTFFIQNFGCRATQADGAALESALAARGLRPAARHEAEFVILNTCTVTAAADQDVRQAVRRIRRENPLARILVTGCYAQRAPEEIAAWPGVAGVIGNTDKLRIPELVAGGLLSPARAGCGTVSTPLVQVGNIEARQEFITAVVEDAAGERTRPNLKIQDGCSNRCSFCIIPSVRGRSRSAPADWVVEQVRALASQYREVVLSGINLGRWGRDLGSGLRLADLVERLLAETDVERLRLSSVEPLDWSDRLLELMAASPRIAQHVHAPLQTGSDAVLRRMRRPYRARHYEERIRKARALMPDAAIGADVMVGFPGETDAEFEENCAFIEALPFTYLHVFTYSARPGTPAASAPGQVPVPVRRERNRVLRELAAKKNLEFRRRLIGKTLQVVTLRQAGTALSGNFVKVRLAQPREPNRLIDVVIGGLTPGGLSEERPVSEPA